MNETSMINEDFTKSQPRSKFQDSNHRDISSDTSEATLVIYNAQTAELVDLNSIEPLPLHISRRKSLEIVNTTFMRACKLKQMVREEDIDINVAMKNIAHIADVLEMISHQKAEIKKM